MGLIPDDAIPRGIPPREAYRRIHTWYRDNISRVEVYESEYAKASAALIRDLPDPETASEEEMQDVFQEVLTNLLEWGYHESDGRCKMAAYAFAGSGSKATR